MLKRGSRSQVKKGLEWFESAQGRRPDVQCCAECRRPCVRAHTSGLAVGSASKLSASRALRLTSGLGSSHSLVRVPLARRFVTERYLAIRAAQAATQYRQVETQPGFCPSAGRRQLATALYPDGVRYRTRRGRPRGLRCFVAFAGDFVNEAYSAIGLTFN